MEIGPNIYHAIVFDIHPKIREFLDTLDQAGQIDHDETNAPHVVSIENLGDNSSIRRCVFMRNGKPENFVIHTRRKAEAIRSWADGDGYVRKETSKEDEAKSRKERDRRAGHPFESIVDSILPKQRT